jgi:hypothetical protein
VHDRVFDGSDTTDVALPAWQACVRAHLSCCSVLSICIGVHVDSMLQPAKASSSTGVTTSQSWPDVLHCMAFRPPASRSWQHSACPRVHAGLSPGALAAVVVAPVTAVLLASGMSAWWFWRRQRSRNAANGDSNKQTPHDMLLDGAEKGDGSDGSPKPKVTVVTCAAQLLCASAELALCYTNFASPPHRSAKNCYVAHH